MGTLEVEFAQPVTVHSYCWKTANDFLERDMVRWELTGWDGQRWVELHAQKRDFDTPWDRFAMMPWFAVMEENAQLDTPNVMEEPSSEWQCEQCTFKNPPDRACCEMC